MKSLKRILSSALVFTMMLGLGVESFAAGPVNLTIEEVVEHVIENSRILDEVEIEIDLSQVSKDRGRWTSRKLKRSEKDLRDAAKAMSTAQSMLDAGISPVTDPEKGLEAGKPLPEIEGVDIKGAIQKELDSNRSQLDSGSYAIADALEEAGATIGSALDFASLDALTLDGSAELIELMPDVAFEVTQASFDIYKNNIALLIQKSYYDVLQLEEMVKVKTRAMERAKKQYEFSKAGYEEGMKAKDDAITAEMYYQGTKIELEKTKGELESAKTELKKNANLDMSKDIRLGDVMLTEVEDFDLQAGLESGMKNRLEIKKTLGEVLIYGTNLSETKKRYTPNTFQYREAELLNKKAGVKYKQAQDEVESSIRKSYVLVQNTGNMLRETEGLVQKAKENVDITGFKYKEGFGVDTSMLASMNLSDSAGTILEVLAAEEKLAEAEETVVKIKYAYNLSRLQHKNNVGDFAY